MSIGHAADCSKFVGRQRQSFYSVSKAVVLAWHRAHVIVGSSVAFGDEMDVIRKYSTSKYQYKYQY